MSADTTERATTTRRVIKRAPMRFKYKLLLIFTSLVGMAVLKTGFLFVIVAMLPSIIGYYMDVSAGRYVFKTIFSCNLTGFLPYLEKLLRHGPSKGALQQVMGDQHTWIVIGGASFIGWLLVKICPVIAQFTVAGLTQTQLNSIQKIQDKIEKDWGPEVTQFSQIIQADHDLADDA